MKKPRPLKKIGRKRRMLGWTLLTLGVLVAGGWVASGWWALYWNRGTRHTAVQHGLLYVLDIAPETWAEEIGVARLSSDGFASRFLLKNDGPHNYLVFSFGMGQTPPHSHFLLVLWPIPLLLWTPAALLLRSGIVARRQALTGKCKSCGYDLAGLGAEATCPECGKGAGTK